MSIDRRLREGMRSSFHEVERDLDVERHLRRAVRRARPRAIARRAGVFVLAISIGGSIFAAGALTERRLEDPRPLDRPPSPATTGAPQTPLDGIYVVRISVEDGREVGLRHADAFGVSGRMKAWFSRDTVSVAQHLGAIDLIPIVGTTEVTGPRLVIHEQGGVTTLEWRRLADGRVRFTVLDDSRTGVARIANEVLWTSHPWTLIAK